jgi:hypothetical protein
VGLPEIYFAADPHEDCLTRRLVAGHYVVEMVVIELVNDGFYDAIQRSKVHDHQGVNVYCPRNLNRQSVTVSVSPGAFMVFGHPAQNMRCLKRVLLENRH